MSIICSFNSDTVSAVMRSLELFEWVTFCQPLYFLEQNIFLLFLFIYKRILIVFRLKNVLLWLYILLCILKISTAYSLFFFCKWWRYSRKSNEKHSYKFFCLCTSWCLLDNKLSNLTKHFLKLYIYFQI